MHGDSYAVSEGRQFLSIVTEVDPDEIAEYQPYEIEAWLDELGYAWSDGSWTPVERATGGEHVE